MCFFLRNYIRHCFFFISLFLCLFFFFFFSSRRRHTRFDCDWSSDVCSSDLIARFLEERGAASVRGIDATTRERLRTILVRAAREGWSYRKTADATVARFQ